MKLILVDDTASNASVFIPSGFSHEQIRALFAMRNIPIRQPYSSKFPTAFNLYSGIEYSIFNFSRYYFSHIDLLNNKIIFIKDLKK